MTNTQSTHLFMRDFAHTDSRSVHAHIKGKSLRANTYRAVEAVCGFLGRAEATDSTFKKVVRFGQRQMGKVAFVEKVG